MTGLSESEQAILAGAERRVGLVILLLVPLGAGVVWRVWGTGMAAAFAFGGALAYLNYRWIVAVVDTLVHAQRGWAHIKLILPIALLAAILYVTLGRPWLSLAGVLAGLFLLVAAILVEAVFELYLAVRL